MRTTINNVNNIVSCENGMRLIGIDNRRFVKKIFIFSCLWSAINLAEFVQFVSTTPIDPRRGPTARPQTQLCRWRIIELEIHFRFVVIISPYYRIDCFVVTQKFDQRSPNKYITQYWFNCKCKSQRQMCVIVEC